MGSTEEEIPFQDDNNEITVLVTGFAPFRPQNPLNPSWEIARLLPAFLPPPKNAIASDISLIAEHPPVRILVYPEPVRVAYKTVRPLVEELWDSRKIDYMIHIGMASGRKFYSVERRGHRDGYVMKDVDEQFLGDVERRKLEGEDWVWYGLPEEILSNVNVDDVWRRWRTALPGLDIRISEDAGRYLCDFIYYSSLAYLTKKNEERRVVFLHVPTASDEASVKTGVDITLELIRAMVQSGRLSKVIEAQVKSSTVDD